MDEMSVTVLGSINLDFIYRVARLPLPGETIVAQETLQLPGGKGANQAVAARQAGAAVRLIGAVGADASGVWVMEELRKLDVDSADLRIMDGQATGTAIVLLDQDGENAIIVHGGANLSVDAASFAPAQSRVRLAQLETPIDAVSAFFREVGGVRMLNAAPFRAEARAIFSRCDVIIVNETELAEYAEAKVSAAFEVEEIALLARRLIDAADQWVIVTCGGKGVVAVRGEETLFVAAQPAKVVDTTGAGDCFCGVLAASIASGMAMPLALDRANRAAGIAVTRIGAMAAMPTAQELDKLLD